MTSTVSPVGTDPTGPVQEPGPVRERRISLLRRIAEEEYILVVLLAAGLLLMALALVVGPEVKGAHRWIDRSGAS